LILLYMRRTNIYLEARQTQALDRLAYAQHVSRGEMIRRLLDRALAEAPDVKEDLAVFDASFGALADDEVLQRGEDDRSRDLDELRRIPE
jgi:hypothetical protein